VGALLAGTILAVSGLAGAQTKTDKSDSQKDADAGIRFRLQVSEKEIGLPIYPGAKPHKDSQADSPGANIGLWGNSFGFKLVVLKMETADPPAKVAAFYQKALAKYGRCLTARTRQRSLTRKGRRSRRVQSPATIRRKLERCSSNRAREANSTSSALNRTAKAAFFTWCCSIRAESTRTNTHCERALKYLP